MWESVGGLEGLHKLDELLDLLEGDGVVDGGANAYSTGRGQHLY